MYVCMYACTHTHSYIVKNCLHIFNMHVQVVYLEFSIRSPPISSRTETSTGQNEVRMISHWVEHLIEMFGCIVWFTLGRISWYLILPLQVASTVVPCCVHLWKIWIMKDHSSNFEPSVFYEHPCHAFRSRCRKQHSTGGRGPSRNKIFDNEQRNNIENIWSYW